MKTTKRSKLMMLLLMVGMLMQCGCGPKPLRVTGFLSDYSRLNSVSDTLLQYVAPTSKFGYSKFIINPVEVHFHDKAKATGMDFDKLNDLVQYMEGAMHNALLDHYQVVKQAGPGVARIRLALTDLEKSSPALNVIPQTKLMGAGLGGAAMEGEILDSLTGEQLAAVVQSQKGKRLSLSGLSKYGDAKAVIDDWAQRLVQKLDEANKPF
jgi:hypothetical protein